MNIFKQYFAKIKQSDSLDEIIFLTVVPLTAIVAFIAMAFFLIIETGLGTLTIISAILCAIIPIVVYIIGLITKNYILFYAIFCLIFTCVFLPIVFFLNGGLFSGMPYFLLGALILTTFSSKKVYRYTTFGISFIVDVFAIILSINHPEILVMLDDDYIQSDMIMSFILVAIAILICNSIVLDIIRKYSETRAILNMHMDKNVTDTLMKKGVNNVNSGEKNIIAVMFIDINNFTSFTESMPSENIAAYLNAFFDVVDECIHKYDGIIDKFIGDCVMAFFIEKEGEHKAVENACLAGILIKEKLELIRTKIFTDFGCELVCSGGISYGEVILGEIGSKNRKDFTVIGEPVNIASRLEELSTKNTILLCQEAAKEVNGKMHLERLKEKVVLKGKSKVSEIYALISVDDCAEVLEIAESIQYHGYTFDICGCRGSFSVSDQRFAQYGGDTSCYVLKKGAYAIVIDCGTGLQRARNIIGNCKKVDVLFTHVHYDHIIGLLDWSVFPKDAELTFYGDFDNWFGDKTISELFRHPYWPIDLSSGKMVSIEKDKKISLNNDIEVEFYESSHPDFGTLINLYIDNDKKICILTDCEDSSVIPDEKLVDCDIMLFDGMYEDENYKSHIGFGHSTWQEGIKLALRNKPGRLIITHHNTQSSDDRLSKLEAQAKKIYPTASFAKAGDRFFI